MLYIIKEAKASKKKEIFRSCTSIEEAVSIIKNRVFKVEHAYDGEGMSFTARTEHYTYRLSEQQS